MLSIFDCYICFLLVQAFVIAKNKAQSDLTFSKDSGLIPGRTSRLSQIPLFSTVYTRPDLALNQPTSLIFCNADGKRFTKCTAYQHTEQGVGTCARRSERGGERCRLQRQLRAALAGAAEKVFAMLLKICIFWLYNFMDQPISIEE